MLQLEHPEIGWIERTGYPSWMQPRDEDDEEESCEDDEYEMYDEDSEYEERRDADRFDD